MPDVKAGFTKTAKVFGDATGQKRNLGFGGSETEALGFRDPKPYDDYWEDGRFHGYDKTMWKFFKSPENVKIEDNGSKDIAVESQKFFIELVDQIGAAVVQNEKTVGDIRRRFKILSVMDVVDAVTAHDNVPIAQRDYLSRVPVRRPIWTSYIGLQILGGSVYNEAYGLSQRYERWREVWKDSDLLQTYTYDEDMKFITSLATSLNPNPLIELDFRRDPGALEHLTAWHGVGDEVFAYDRALQNTRFAEPVHGNSLITERWGEICIQAITPVEGIFMSDPADGISRWATPIFAPPASAVAFWINGEIRTSNVAANVLDNKMMRRQEKQEKEKSRSQVKERENQEFTSKIDIAVGVAQNMKHAMLDNMEILVATRVTHGGPGRLKTMLAQYDMTLSPLRLRQPEALLSSFPAYPNPVFRAPKTNFKRAKLSNQAFAGAIAMSGIFRNTGSGDPEDPIWLGFVDSMFEYKEVSFGLTDAYKMSGSPIIFVSGSTGSGKSQTLLQIMAQIKYMGFNQTFLNPKPQASLAGFCRELGGLFISFGDRYLDKQPGLLDLFNYFDTVVEKGMKVPQSDGEERITATEYVRQNRSTIANKIAADVMRILDTSSESGTKAREFAAQLRSRITQNTLDPRTRCTGDVIFGIKDRQTGKDVVPGVNAAVEYLKGKEAYVDIERLIENRMNTSSVWRSMVSRTPIADNSLVRELKSGRPVLIEWDGSFSVPDKDLPQDRYTDEQVDSIISIQTVFMITVQTIGSDRVGGALIIDEAWSINSPQVQALLTRSGREWRQYNICVILASQFPQDLVASSVEKAANGFNLGSSISRYLFLAMNERDLEGNKLFYEITGMEKTPEMDRYMRNGRPRIHKETGQLVAPPHGFWSDDLQGVKTKIVLGPYPEKELNLGRTDFHGERMRQEAAGLLVDDDNEIISGMDRYFDTEAQRQAIEEQDAAAASSMDAPEESRGSRLSSMIRGRRGNNQSEDDE